jgi:hypothetical protein
MGTVPEVAVRQGRRWKLLAALGGEQLVCQGQQLLTETVGEQAVVADSHETLGQNVQEEAAQELPASSVITRCLLP